MKHLAHALLIWSLGSGITQAAPPISAYATLPAGFHPELSPDGSAIAMVGSSGGKPAFIISYLDGRPRRAFATGDWIPEWIGWKSPDLLVAGVLNTWLDGTGYGLRTTTRLIVLSADGSRAMPVDLSFAGRFQPLLADRLVSRLPDDPDHVLMATLDTDGPSVSQIDLRDGHRSQVRDSRAGVFRWFADPQGVIRAAGKYRNDPSTQRRPVVDVLVRSDAQQDFHTVANIKIDGSASLDMASLDPNDADRILLSGIEPDGFYAIRAYSIATSKPGDIVARAAGADVEPIRRNNRLVAYLTDGRDRSITYLAPEWAHDAQAITHALGGDGWVEIVDRTRDGRHVLAALRDGALPVQYWMLDRAAGKSSLHPVLEGGGVPPSSVVTPRWISFTARDGMKIPALLTLPNGATPGHPVPFVVMPHDGPSDHDVVAFDWQVQFLVSRGYGVLQPQFRGSTGFGAALHDAGRREWGGAMQDDITDGTKYVIAQHFADPGRIAIVGGGFGGYSALEGVIREPALYRAAAAWAPMTDLPIMFGGPHVYAQNGRDLLMPAGDPDALSAASPANSVDRIAVPVLLMHGKRDYTVPVRQSTTLQAAMKRAGKPVQAIYVDGADHYLERESDRLAWLTALEGFLAANIGSGKTN